MLRNLAALARARPPVVSPRRFMPRTKIKERTGDEPGKLILIRHGESTWNASKLFTGWVDVDLSETGLVDDALQAYSGARLGRRPLRRLDVRKCRGVTDAGVLAVARGVREGFLVVE